MKITKIKLTDLKRPERNVRMHTDKQIAEFKRSVIKFDQIRPIVVDENYTILCGNGLYDTLLALGRETADCFIKEGLSENNKKKLMLADNRIFSLGTDDLDAFDAIIQSLEGDLDIPGYDDELLQSLIAESSEITEQLAEYGTIDPEDVHSIREAGQRYEAQIQTVAAPREAGQDPAPPQEERPCVVCPKCGETLWL